MKWLHALSLALGSSLTLTACGVGLDGDPAPGEPTAHSAGWVTITSPSDTTTYCADVTLRGEAFISPTWFRCCSGSATDTGVTVTWMNSSTGQSGAADQSVDICYLFGTPYLCGHTWSAKIPLSLGQNSILVTATDPSGNQGNASMHISKPEESYALSGTLRTAQGASLTTAQDDLKMQLAGGATGSKTVRPSVDGTYLFTCVPPGSYQITPTPTQYSYVFQPTIRYVVVSNQDMNGLDFSTEVHTVSGTFTFGADVYPSNFLIGISDGGPYRYMSIHGPGPYSFMVPSGTYTVTLIDLWSIHYAYYPQSRTVVVKESNVTGVDFSVQR